MLSRILPASLVLLVTGVLHAAARPELRLTWESGKLSLDADNVPLSRVLQAVATETGSEITGAAGLDVRISAHFAQTELMQALRELLSGVDYAISAGPPITRIVIVGIRRGPAGTAAADPSADIQPEPTEAGEPPAPPADAPEDPLAAIDTAATDRDSAALNAYLRDGDAAEQSSAFQALAAQNRDAAVESLAAEIQDTTQPNRLQALQLLVQSSGAGETVILDTLTAALRDADPAFNAFAIQALAGLGNADAAEALSDAFHRMDAAMKMTTLQTVANTQTGLLLLQEAASDSDEAVSAAAKDLLKQLTARP